MKIYGKIITDPLEWLNYHGSMGIDGWQYYALGIKRRKDGTISRHEFGIRTGSIAGCSGKANQLVGKPYYHPKDTMSWGYEGFGSDLTAAWLIYQALWYEQCGMLMGEAASSKDYEGKMYIELHPIMERHYKAFSKEVVANLPAEWELDTEWIKKWVMKREDKPS